MLKCLGSVIAGKALPIGILYTHIGFTWLEYIFADEYFNSIYLYI